MTVDDHRAWREQLGAYVLGQLSEPEREQTEAHLEDCAECRAELAALEPLARMLPLANPDHVAAPRPVPPAGLEARITGQIADERRTERRSRRRRRFGFAFAGVSAAAAAAAVAVALLVSNGGSGGGNGAEQLAFQNLPHGIDISATLRPKQWGTEVGMQVSGIRSGTLCRVYLRRADGGAEPVGSFRYRYSDEHSEEVLTGALDLSDVRAVEVRAGHQTFVQRLPSGMGAATASSQATNEKETT